jgi:hypothetical protein
MLGGLTSGPTNKSWSLLGSLDDLAWSPPIASGDSGYPNLDPRLAGLNASVFASYVPGSPPLTPPDTVEDQAGAPLYAYVRNGLLNSPLRPVSDQLSTDEIPDANPSTSPEGANPKPLLVAGEGEDGRKKMEAPAVSAGLLEPDLSSLKNVPTLPSIPPFDGLPTLPSEIPAPLGGRGVWDSPPTARGRALEQLFGHNLHPNYPTVDIWEPDSGTVTSLKSIDLDSPTYKIEVGHAECAVQQA